MLAIVITAVVVVAAIFVAFTTMTSKRVVTVTTIGVVTTTIIGLVPTTTTTTTQITVTLSIPVTVTTNYAYATQVMAPLVTLFSSGYVFNISPGYYIYENFTVPSYASDTFLNGSYFSNNNVEVLVLTPVQFGAFTQNPSGVISSGDYIWYSGSNTGVTIGHVALTPGQTYYIVFYNPNTGTAFGFGAKSDTVVIETTIAVWSYTPTTTVGTTTLVTTSYTTVTTMTTVTTTTTITTTTVTTTTTTTITTTTS